jgi:hypothetical protein
MSPCASSTQAAAARRVQIIAVKEAVIDHDVAAAPTGLPSPAAPTAAEIKSRVDARAESEVHAFTERRIKSTGIRIIERRTPNRHRIVVRHVHHLRIAGFDLNDVVVGAHRLLARCSIGIIRVRVPCGNYPACYRPFSSCPEAVRWTCAASSCCPAAPRCRLRMDTSQ